MRKKRVKKERKKERKYKNEYTRMHIHMYANKRKKNTVLTIHKPIHHVLVIIPMQGFGVLGVIGIPLPLHVIVNVAFLRVVDPLF